MMKTKIVPKHPPPNFFAPYPAINPLNILFMINCFYVTVNLRIKDIILFIGILKKVSLFTDFWQKKTPTFLLVLFRFREEIFYTVCVWFLKTNFPSKASIKIILSVVIFPARISFES